jgi:membrane associated rhomboid family serine protease
VGASGALFGLLGGGLADLLVHWASLDPQMRKMQLIQQVIMIVIWMFISFGSKYIDAWGHLGGLIFGFLIACAYWLPETELHPKLKAYGRPGAIAVTSMLFLLLGGLFFGRIISTEQLFAGYNY